MNNKFFQIAGPFFKNDELLNTIKKKIKCNGISSVGIQAHEGHGIYINGQFFVIGNTEILYFDEVIITSLYFAQNEDSFALVDCILF